MPTCAASKGSSWPLFGFSEVAKAELLAEAAEAPLGCECRYCEVAALGIWPLTGKLRSDV